MMSVLETLINLEAFLRVSPVMMIPLGLEKACKIGLYDIKP